MESSMNVDLCSHQTYGILVGALDCVQLQQDIKVLKHCQSIHGFSCLDGGDLLSWQPSEVTITNP
jgi:hypothetical protein